MSADNISAVIFNIERHALHDGPGIRTLVFIKGCTMRCEWCSNPEGLSPHQELLFRSNDCTSCLRCVEACPNGAVKVSEDRSIFTDRELCTACGLCVKVCPSGARQVAGQIMSTNQVLEEVLKDEVFYRNSGGGVTVSGGEPLTRPLFVKTLFESLQLQCINTAVETCGNVPWQNFEAVLPHTDLFLYDVKHMDTKKHSRYTYADNGTIIENLRQLDRTDTRIIVRIPVIPLVNDNPDDITSIARFTMDLSSQPEIHLLPYHTFGRAKYHHLEIEYPPGKLDPLPVKTLNELEKTSKKINPRTIIEL